MKRILNAKTLKRSLAKRKLSELDATNKAALMSEDEKNEVQATVLRELTLVCTNRIRLLEQVLGRKVKISTSAPMGHLLTEPGSTPTYSDDERTFRITVE